MNLKSIIAVIVIAIFIGVLYVVFEKNFTGGALSSSQTKSAQELSKGKVMQTPEPASSLINLPSPENLGAPIDGSTDLLQAAEALEMRDYSSYFEELKDSVSE